MRILGIVLMMMVPHLPSAHAQGSGFQATVECLDWLGFHDQKPKRQRRMIFFHKNVPQHEALPEGAVTAEVVQRDGLVPYLHSLATLDVEGTPVRGAYMISAENVVFIPFTGAKHVGNLTAWGPVNGSWHREEYCLSTRLPGDRTDRFITAVQEYPEGHPDLVKNFVGSRLERSIADNCGNPAMVDPVKPVPVSPSIAADLRARIAPTANFLASRLQEAPADYFDDYPKVKAHIDACMGIVTTKEARDNLNQVLERVTRSATREKRLNPTSSGGAD
jgi:hypothetical protein